MNFFLQRSVFGGSLAAVVVEVAVVSKISCGFQFLVLSLHTKMSVLSHAFSYIDLWIYRKVIIRK